MDALMSLRKVLQEEIDRQAGFPRSHRDAFGHVRCLQGPKSVLSQSLRALWETSRSLSEVRGLWDLQDVRRCAPVGLSKV